MSGIKLSPRVGKHGPDCVVLQEGPPARSGCGNVKDSAECCPAGQGLRTLTECEARLHSTLTCICSFQSSFVGGRMAVSIISIQTEETD